MNRQALVLEFEGREVKALVPKDSPKTKIAFPWDDVDSCLLGDVGTATGSTTGRAAREINQASYRHQRATYKRRMREGRHWASVDGVDYLSYQGVIAYAYQLRNVLAGMGDIASDTGRCVRFCDWVEDFVADFLEGRVAVVPAAGHTLAAPSDERIARLEAMARETVPVLKETTEVARQAAQTANSALQIATEHARRLELVESGALSQSAEAGWRTVHQHLTLTGMRVSQEGKKEIGALCRKVCEERAIPYQHVEKSCADDGRFPVRRWPIDVIAEALRRLGWGRA